MEEVIIGPSLNVRIVTILFMALVMTSAAMAYQRPKSRKVLSVTSSNSDGLTPQQVHISMVGSDKMRISWITDDESPSIVEYGTSSNQFSNSINGSTSKYSYLIYNSGHIHEVVIGPLKPNTVYYYRCGSNSSRSFSFKTPPVDLPLKFVVIGDLGQTEWTNSTLSHVAKSGYDMLLLPGDLSYADYVQSSWDSFGRLVEPLASSRPWMVTHGNHEVEKIPVLEQPFKAYNARWRMPYDLSSSTSNLYYSFDVAGGQVHIIMLGSYTDFNPGSDQHNWLKSDLAPLDRKKTPWVFALIHAPWYSSNKAHQGEKESVEMKEAMEALLFGARVDAVFAGHVHAYERFTRVYNGSASPCGPVHITIGDGGNREGLARDYTDPKPEISMFREASFGHGQLDVMNGSHALWTWRRNDDDVAQVADKFWLTSLASHSACK